MNKKSILVILIIVLTVITFIAIMKTVEVINRKEFARPIVYVVVKSVDPDVEFWEVAKSGANVAGIELGVDVVWLGPRAETDVDEQINIVNEVILKKPDAIVLAASDFTRLQDTAEKIMDSNITLVTLDSEVQTSYEHSFVATNNIEAAKEAARKMAEVIGEEGKVAIISHVFGVSTAIDRERGFREEINTYENIQLIDKMFYSDADTKKSYRETLNMLEEFPGIKGIFGTNETTAVGIGRAVKDKGLAGKVKVIGFDSNKELVQLIEEGVIDAVMIQKPFNMGYMGIKKAVEEYQNDKAEKKFIDTGSVLITKENLYEKENQKLIFPFAK